MASKKRPFKLFEAVKNALRRLHFRSPDRQEVLRRNKVKRGQYKCEKCKKIFRRTEVQVDHLIPVVDPNIGFVSWEDYIARLFCSIENLQLLCMKCHHSKTEQENFIRRNRSKKK